MKNQIIKHVIAISLLSSSCQKGDANNPESAIEPLKPHSEEEPTAIASPTPTPSLSPTADAQAEEDAPSPSLENLGRTPLEANGVPKGFQEWNELNKIDPRRFALDTFVGSDPSKALFGEDDRCEVYLLAEFLDERGDMNYVLRSSFSHGSTTHSYLLGTLNPMDKALSVKDSMTNSQGYLQLNQAGILTSAQEFRVKWFHINHFDTAICENLKLEIKE